MNSKELWNKLETSKDSDIFTDITMSIMYLINVRGYDFNIVLKLIKNGVKELNRR